MNSPEQLLAPPPARSWRALLVLGLWAGLLAMHGLAPGGVVHEHAGPLHGTAQVEVQDDCGHGGGCGGGHLAHADATCAAAAVSGAPTLPALVPDPVAATVRAGFVRSYAVAAPDSARAPPSLAELQLLRI
ncbi:DUF6153 family protein [Streptomyces resistomycificus]|uniref:Uncharacterized protein n=1 Tax=Streptomyces resistomycificus TaxID=67356 RepID=A0A0L8KS01_9ACTN|nr:DUF6153 family protein [Streptomyces resistomycificus]KOG28524.1 hypothetical protein ADK37_39565 [Streptomyces resistomycificus]KUN91193.1 hypothetical protein AQJ84_37005 [Streptomyces resistomycificus]